MNKYVLTDEAKEKLDKIANFDVVKGIGYAGFLCGGFFASRVVESVLEKNEKTNPFSWAGGFLFSLYLANQIGVFTMKVAGKIRDEIMEDNEDG